MSDEPERPIDAGNPAPTSPDDASNQGVSTPAPAEGDDDAPGPQEGSAEG